MRSVTAGIEGAEKQTTRNRFTERYGECNDSADPDTQRNGDSQRILVCPQRSKPQQTQTPHPARRINALGAAKLKPRHALCCVTRTRCVDQATRNTHSTMKRRTHPSNERPQRSIRAWRPCSGRTTAHRTKSTQGCNYKW
jgi:hypothetical protein